MNQNKTFLIYIEIVKIHAVLLEIIWFFFNNYLLAVTLSKLFYLFGPLIFFSSKRDDKSTFFIGFFLEINK